MTHFSVSGGRYLTGFLIQRLHILLMMLFLPLALLSLPAFAADQQKDIYAGLPLTVTHIGEVSYDDGNTVGIRFSVPLDGSKPFQ
ncbi:MAG: hypothetical protein R3207_06625, partial [Oceanospirillum sp.]|nr:hypothetical protein [Oceanospirillum sp.]